MLDSNVTFTVIGIRRNQSLPDQLVHGYRFVLTRLDVVLFHTHTELPSVS